MSPTPGTLTVDGELRLWVEFDRPCAGLADRFVGFNVDVQAMAAEACHHCPIEAACLDYALENRERHGVWGGMTEVERAPLLRRDRRVAS